MVLGEGTGVIPAAPPPSRRSWPARLELTYTHDGQKTLVHRRHIGPFLTQRPFYPETDGTCHNYILHPPGGVAGGDILDLDIRVGSAARCLLTAPGATKVYRSLGEISRHRIAVTVADRAVCELMPMETILFDQARADFETTVSIQGTGVFFAWAIVSRGRPAAAEKFGDGCFVQKSEK